MANPLKGEVSFLDGEETITVGFDINTMCTLEGALAMDAQAIAERFATDNRVSFLRTLLWGGLQEHHAGMTMVEAGRLMHRVGVGEIRGAVIAALRGAFPAPEDADTDADPPMPPTEAAAADGTGPGSSPSGAS